ncbi:GGDEF domain-containing protein [Neorhizobium alkalisoli]|uniref:diguanylate cyclase n=1 Tax=Neorhizobium alkalisoli TaxID=528178 RepID=A0A561QWC6_9HYPH|nr:GGDEF domain-containing protein [Neorhizobium alkalisoli]TWF54675.1 diguanylate cyclase (GGDEF)-like protein [Neorhizobium alkalisoli]
MIPTVRVNSWAISRSLTAQIFVICFVSIHVPLIAVITSLAAGFDAEPVTLLLLMLAATLLGTIACLSSLWVLLRPLRGLTTAIRMYRAEGKPVRMQLKRQDEIGLLANAVTAMVAEVENLMQKLRRQAMTDPLTGLGNRRWLNERVSQERARAERQVEPLSVITFDLDHFKSINDRYGHDTGDAVIVATGQLVSGALRAYDLAARIGGEEFCIILPKTRQAEAAIMAERLRTILESTLVPPLRQGRLTASFGVYEARSGESLQEMLAISDKALYEAKRSGRNCVRQAGVKTEA